MSGLSSRLNGSVPSSDIVNAMHGFVKKIKHSYPDISANTRTLVQDHVPSRSDLIHARHALGDMAGAFLHSLKTPKLVLLASGVGYALYTSLRYCREERVAQRISASMRRKPLKTTLVAVGIGLILGRLL